MITRREMEELQMAAEMRVSDLLAEFRDAFERRPKTEVEQLDPRTMQRMMEQMQNGVQQPLG